MPSKGTITISKAFPMAQAKPPPYDVAISPPPVKTDAKASLDWRQLSGMTVSIDVGLKEPRWVPVDPGSCAKGDIFRLPKFQQAFWLHNFGVHRSTQRRFLRGSSGAGATAEPTLEGFAFRCSAGGRWPGRWCYLRAASRHVTDREGHYSPRQLYEYDGRSGV